MKSHDFDFTYRERFDDDGGDITDRRFAATALNVTTAGLDDLMFAVYWKHSSLWNTN